MGSNLVIVKTKEESDSQETESAEVSEEEETEKVNLDHIPRKSTAERNKEARKKEEVRLNRRKKEEKDLLDSITKLEETKKQVNQPSWFADEVD